MSRKTLPPRLAKQGGSDLSRHGVRENFEDQKLNIFVKKLIKEDYNIRCIESDLKQLRDYVEAMCATGNLRLISKYSESAWNKLQELFYKEMPKHLKTEVAEIISLLGFSIGPEASRYTNWVFNCISGAPSEQVKTFYLYSLQRTIEIDAEFSPTGRLANLMPEVMGSLRKLLESADDPDLLEAVVDAALAVAINYPNVFQSHFEEIVDVIVGWHIDPAQSRKTVDYASNVLRQLHPFWTSRTEYSLHLLCQFLDDIEAYRSDIDGPHAIEDEADEVFDKITALVKVFGVVVQAFREQATSSSCRAVIENCLQRVTNCVIELSGSHFNFAFISQVNKTICGINGTAPALIVGDVSTDGSSSGIVELVFNYLFQILAKDPGLTPEVVTCCLSAIREIIAASAGQIPLPLFEKLLMDKDKLPKYRFCGDTDIMSICLEIYQAALFVKDVPTLETVYKILLSEMQSACAIMLQNDIESDPAFLRTTPGLYIVSDPYNMPLVDESNAEKVLVMNLSSLSLLAAQKTSLIANYALKPSLFDLFCKSMCILTFDYGHLYPDVQHALIYLLYSHCSASNHFVNSCIPETQDETAEDSAFSFSVSTRYNFLQSLDFISSCLALRELPSDVHSLCLTWIQEALNHLTADSFSPRRFKAITSSKQFQKLIVAVIKSATKTLNPDIHEQLVSVLVTIKDNLPFDKPFIMSLSQLCLIMTYCYKDFVCDCYKELIRALPIGSFIRLKPVEPGSLTSLFKHRDAKRTLMRKVPNPNLLAYDFKFILDGFLADIDTPQTIDGLSLESLFFKNVSDYEKEVTPLMDLSIQFIDVSWFNAVWEAANYCIVGKLKTALGKANETFSSFESVLRQHVGLLKANECSIPSLKNAVLTPKYLQCYEKPRRLLLFLDCLEKQLYNAGEGLGCSLPPANKASRIFFRTNKSTCRIWFRQIRMLAAYLAQACNMPSTVIFHVTEYLSDLAGEESSAQEVTIEALLMLFSALIETGNDEMIAGVNVWFSSKFGRSFPMYKAFIQHARGDYETALRSYTSSLHSDNTRSERSKNLENSPAVLRSVYWNCLKITKSLSLYDEFSEFGQSFKTKSEEIGMSTVINRDLKFMESLSSFDSLDFVGCQNHLHGSLFTDPTAENLQNVPIAGMEWNVADLSRSIENCLLFAASKTAIKIQEDASFPAQEAACWERDLLTPIGQASVWALEAGNSSCNNTSFNRFLYYRKFTDFISYLQRNEAVPKSFFQLWHGSDSTPDLNVLEASGRHLVAAKLYNHILWSSLGPNELVPEESMANSVSQKVVELELAFAKMTRKSGCNRRALGVLLDHFGDGNGRMADFPDSALSRLLELCKEGDDDEQRILDSHFSTARREAAKVLFAAGRDLDSFNQMSSLIRMYLNARDSNYEIDGTSASTCVLALAKWISSDSKYSHIIADHCQGDILPDGNISENFQDIISRSIRRKSALTEFFGDIRAFNVIPESEMVTCSLYDLAIDFQDDSAKAWFRFASWCFKFGKKLVDHACTENTLLSEAEVSQATDYMKAINLDEDTCKSILAVLNQAHFTALRDEDIGRQDSIYQDGAVAVQRQLLLIAPKLEVFPVVLENLVGIWSDVCKRIFSLYNQAVGGYFKYLSLGSNSHDDSNATATLRLLRLLVKHAWELQDVLESGLASTPTRPWHGICPQLFSRLNHPEAYVRKSVADLLSRLAGESPHLIVYPVVVGCEQKISEGKMKSKSAVLKKMLSTEEEDDVSTAVGSLAGEETVSSQGDVSSSQKSDHAGEVGDEEETTVGETVTPVTNIDDEDEDEGDEDDVDADDLSESRAEIEHCYRMLLDTLTQNDAQLVSDVTLFVNELRRVSVLWDELWLSALVHYSGEVGKCLNSMENEKRKLDRNKLLSVVERNAILTAKYSAYIKPVVFVFDQLYELTSRPPETQHEKWFVDSYAERLNTAMKSLKNPEDIRKPMNAWEAFDKLHQDLVSRNSRKSSFMLEMKNIAPKLSSLKDASIPLVLSESVQLVTIQSFFNSITIMPTKTKPKKLSILGNNGKTYSYLFKGLEDLHLDERIMQFLSIVNTMFEKSNRKDNTPLFRARNYAVTPLGPRSGLIQWVDGATPLFGLYKKWQQREMLAAAMKKQQVAGQPVKQTDVLPPVQRPSELYQVKIVSALAAIGAPENTPRKEWPISVLTEVIEELVRETPNYLLSKEMWCSCTNTDEWWMMVQQFNHCNALMSVVGYIIGLGDRHLDNILVDLSTGEVVHIDYNVCFEKGRNLRVPEKVPFRLTQNLQKALGFTGYEGMFRISAENVLKVLRRGREALLTLLEAFVYDPLVDWTHQSDMGFLGALQFKKNSESLKAEKREMDFTISQNLLSAKMLEIRSQWQKNSEDVQRVLRRLPDCVVNLSQNYLSYQETDKRLDLLENCKRYLEAAATSTEHSFWSLRERVENASMYQSLEENFKNRLRNHMQLCESWIAAVEELVAAFKRNEVSDIASSLAQELSLPPAGYLESQTYLRSVNQMHLFEECSVSEKEFGAFVEQLRQSSAICATLILKYLSAVSQLPQKPSVAQVLLECCKELETPGYSRDQATFDKLKGVNISSSEEMEKAMLLDSVLLAEVNEESEQLSKFNSKLLATGGSNLTGFRELTVRAQQEKNNALARCIEENSRSRSAALLSTVVSYLSSLAGQYMVMESVACRAEDAVLKNLLSEEGDWFLDEMELLSFNVINLVKHLSLYIPVISHHNQSITPHVDAVIAAFSSYSQLTELYQTVVAHIVPECVNYFGASDTSEECATFMTCIGEVKEEMTLVADRIEMAFHGEQLDNAVPDKLDQSVNRLTSLSSQAGGVLSKLLLCFSQLECNYEELMSIANNSYHPDESNLMLRHIESIQVSEQVLAVPRSDAGRMRILKYWLKCQSVMAVCSFLQRIHAFVGQMRCPIENPIRLVDVLDPIRSFIAGFVRREIIGLPLRCLTNLILHCSVHLGVNLPKQLRQAVIDEGAEVISLDMIQQKVRDHVLKNCGVSVEESIIITNLFAEFEALARQVTQVNHYESQRAMRHRMYQVLAACVTKSQWNNHYTLAAAGKTEFVAPSRVLVVAEIAQSLANTRDAYEKAKQSFSDLRLREDKIEARLKWAAGLYKDSLERVTTSRDRQYQSVGDLLAKCDRIVHWADVICKEEKSHASSSAPECEHISGFQEILQLRSKMDTHSEQKVSIGEIERYIVEKHPTGCSMTEESRNALVTAIDKELKSEETKASTRKTGLNRCREEFRIVIQPFKHFLTAHNKLMVDIKNLLKPLNRDDELSTGSMKQVAAMVRQYVTDHNSFTENVTSLLNATGKIVSNREPIWVALKSNPSLLSSVKTNVSTLNDLVHPIYKNLLSISAPIQTGDETRQASFATAVASGPKLNVSPLLPIAAAAAPTAKSDAVSVVAKPSVSSIKRDPKTGKALQERNAYAISVWHKVKFKLDGRESENQKRMSVPEHVEYIIQEAVSLDNLAQMYEGWTAWV